MEEKEAEQTMKMVERAEDTRGRTEGGGGGQNLVRDPKGFDGGEQSRAKIKYRRA